MNRRGGEKDKQICGFSHTSVLSVLFVRSMGSTFLLLIIWKCLDNINFLTYLFRSTNSWNSFIFSVGKKDNPLLNSSVSVSDKR